MVTPTIDLAELFRHIQEINFNLESASMETKMELDFYKTDFSAWLIQVGEFKFYIIVFTIFPIYGIIKKVIWIIFIYKRR